MFYTVVKIIINIINTISGFITDLFSYKTIYKIAGLFITRKFKPAKNMHKYAILVAARNEENVIGQLVDSINSQDYPRELVTIFVVADNCTDKTAEISRKLGAVCYERNDPVHRTKGYALQFLVECIRRDYGIDAFEGYFIFDADNLLNKDFISRMNDAFDSGEKIITSYRNTKNFDDNWISASYGIHWLRTVRNEHRPRSFFRLATRIQGTGFLFAHEVIKNGWNYTSLTEDRAFCADAVANGYTISYNNAAEFFDEQPVDIKIAMRQRIRWAKGHLQAFTETGGKLFSHIFVTHGAANRESTKDTPWFKRLLLNIRLRFMSFDMLSIVYPRSLISSFKKLIIFILRVILILGGALVVTKNFAPDLFSGYDDNSNIFFGMIAKLLPDLFKKISESGFIDGIFSFFGLDFNGKTPGCYIAYLALFTFLWTVNTYFFAMFSAAYIYIVERKRIKHIKWYKKIFFCMTFPIFDLIGKLSMIIALFKKVEWKPIPHNVSLSIDDMKKE